MSSDYIVPPCHENVEILLEDESFLLVNKPSLLLSVPGKHPANQDCVITRVQNDYPDALIVHRLDLDTSGLMVLARGKEAHRRLSRQFQDREVEKEYIAVAFGLIQDDCMSLDFPLICDWPNRPKQKVDYEIGKSALTHLEVINREIEKDQTRVRLKPVTGRSHQLRVHLAAIGHPILGCDFYAHAEALNRASRLLLHARKLIFKHPFSQDIIEHICDPVF